MAEDKSDSAPDKNDSTTTENSTIPMEEPDTVPESELPTTSKIPTEDSTNDDVENGATDTTKKRDSWGNGMEFLMSCIALSVGLGNVWRFPFIALENGGGAFVIPYIIVLFLVGRPIYYLEMVVGQFSSRSSINVFDLCPLTRGIGYGQMLATMFVTSYYASTVAIIIRFFVSSFYPTLPWSHCREEWGENCYDSAARLDPDSDHQLPVNGTTSAEFFFIEDVLKEKETIFDGVGTPDLQLALYLLLTWTIIALILIRGVKSSGKAAYFLALFPYLIMTILFFRSVTLPGAGNGILFLFKPEWSLLYAPSVWYAAITQVFFSLSICYGVITMFASYNNFSHNILRDATIITMLDTFTSLFSGIIIFGILGNLAYESGTTDITAVVQGGSGLAFVSYPNAISKFDVVPQLFAVLFFFMLFVLGIGSNVGLATCLFTVLKDRFPHLKRWQIVIPLAITEFFIGIMYTTPGGQHLLNFIDFFGVSFIVFVMGIAQLITFCWIYGVDRLCFDIQFMLGFKTGWYWRICWSIVTPALMIAIFIYFVVELAQSPDPITYKLRPYPNVVYIIGWIIFVFGVAQIPGWAVYAVYKQKGSTLVQKIRNAAKPLATWGPIDPELNKKYHKELPIATEGLSIWGRFKQNVTG